MFELNITYKNGKPFDSVTCGAMFCELGKSRQSIIRLRGWKVAPSHARFERTLAGVFVEDVSRGFGLRVNGEAHNRYGPLSNEDVIEIAEYRVQVVPLQTESEELPETDEAASDDTGDTGSAPVSSDDKSITDDSREQYMEWSKYLHKELFRQMDLRRLNIDALHPEKMREQLGALVDGIVENIRVNLPPSLDVELLKKLVLDEAVGLGPLEDFLEDPSITEIMVNRYNDIYIERSGRLEKTVINFSSDEAVLATIERIISPLGRRIDESSPMVDARLRDGSRVNAIIPPLAISGPCLTIRKFSDKKLGAKDLVAFGSVNEPMVEFMRVCVEQRRNIVVSGGTGSGKTTLLNILSNFIPHHERVITVEDAAELKLALPHVVSLEARPANMEGKGQVAIRDLVRNCLRMRPDRIVVGECRGGEALDMLQAMNTGHDGSLTTAHANNPRDMLRRLEVMVLMAGMDLPVMAIREQVASAVNVVIQQSRFGDGSRRITSISEITGITDGTIQMHEIFRFQQQGYDENGRVKGQFQATGRVPYFYEDLRARGIPVDMSIFNEP